MLPENDPTKNVIDSENMKKIRRRLRKSRKNRIKNMEEMRQKTLKMWKNWVKDQQWIKKIPHIRV